MGDDGGCDAMRRAVMAGLPDTLFGMIGSER